MNNNRTAVLAIVLVSYLMIVLDISIVITALLKVQNELGFSPTDDLSELLQAAALVRPLDVG